MVRRVYSWPPPPGPMSKPPMGRNPSAEDKKQAAINYSIYLMDFYNKAAKQKITKKKKKRIEMNIFKRVYTFFTAWRYKKTHKTCCRCEKDFRRREMFCFSHQSGKTYCDPCYYIEKAHRKIFIFEKEVDRRIAKRDYERRVQEAVEFKINKTPFRD